MEDAAPLHPLLAHFLHDGNNHDDDNEREEPFHTSLAPDVLELLQMGEGGQDEPTALLTTAGLVDWAALGPLPADTAVAIGTTKALARQCDERLRALGDSEFEEVFREQLARSPHASLLRFLFRRLVEGDAVACFLMGVCLLEHSLYALYHAELAKGDANNNNQPQQQAPSAGSPHAGLILKELLGTTQLQGAMPPHSLGWLRVVFSPQFLNLRNAVWHGFVAPHELAPSFAALTLVVVLGLPDPGEDRALAQPWDVKELDDQLPDNLDSATQPLCDSPNHVEAVVEAVVKHSRFLVPGREAMLRTALQRLASGHDLEFMVVVLPVLEHSLRRVFCAINRTGEMLCAETGRYYSTLDGFGQRAKHQVLIDTHIHNSDVPNKLRGAVGKGCCAVLLDLFMMDNGPGLRGKLCHGEIDLNALATPQPAGAQRRSARLLLATFLALCARFPRTVGMEAKAWPGVVQDCARAVDAYHTLFHPHVLLRHEVEGAERALESLATAFAAREWVVGEGPEGSDECVVRVTGKDLPHELAIAEKANRVLQPDQPVTPQQLQAPKKSETLPVLVLAWEASLVGLHDRMRVHLEAPESHRAPLVPLSRPSPSLPPLAFSRPPPGEQDARSAGAGAAAVVDAEDGVYNGVGCLRALCFHCSELCNGAVGKLTELEGMVVSGAARTLHRKQYLASLQVGFARDNNQQQQQTQTKPATFAPSLSPPTVLRGFALLGAATLVVVEHHARQQPAQLNLARKWLAFLSSFNACVTNSEGRKSYDKAILQCLDFFASKVVREALPPVE